MMYKQQLLSGLHLLKYIWLKREGLVGLGGRRKISACWEKLCFVPGKVSLSPSLLRAKGKRGDALKPPET